MLSGEEKSTVANEFSKRGSFAAEVLEYAAPEEVAKTSVPNVSLRKNAEEPLGEAGSQKQDGNSSETKNSSGHLSEEGKETDNEKTTPQGANSATGVTEKSDQIPAASSHEENTRKEKRDVNSWMKQKRTSAQSNQGEQQRTGQQVKTEKAEPKDTSSSSRTPQKEFAREEHQHRKGKDPTAEQTHSGEGNKVESEQEKRKEEMGDNIQLSKMSDATKCWQSLFFLLFNNHAPDDGLLDMWAQFKKGCLQRSDIEAAIESVKGDIQENEREVLHRICSDENASDAARLLCKMKECAQLKDDTWRLLFTAIRDRVSCPISRDKKVPIVMGGQARFMTLQEIEEKLIQEDILTSHSSVPDQMIHNDLMDAQFNTENFRKSLKKSYENRLSKEKETMKKNNPKLKPGELEKKAAAQAKLETKQSKEAQILKLRVAMMAEHKYQKSIERVMKEYGIPALVLRGVNTYKDIAKFLESFGIEVSRLKAFKCDCKKNECKCTFECEHDVVTMALLPTGPFVFFSQVMQAYVIPDYLSIFAGENQRGQHSLGRKPERPEGGFKELQDRG